VRTVTGGALTLRNWSVDYGPPGARSDFAVTLSAELALVRDEHGWTARAMRIVTSETVIRRWRMRDRLLGSRRIVVALNAQGARLGLQ